MLKDNLKEVEAVVKIDQEAEELIEVEDDNRAKQAENVGLKRKRVSTDDDLIMTEVAEGGAGVGEDQFEEVYDENSNNDFDEDDDEENE